jgi:hypothetical protein
MTARCLGAGWAADRDSVNAASASPGRVSLTATSARYPASLAWSNGLAGEAGRVQLAEDLLFLLGRQLRRMAELLPFLLRGRLRVPLPVQRRPRFPQDPARGRDPDRVLHRGKMRVDDLIQFCPESALREMSSSSAKAFPAISRAVFVFPSSLSSRLFRD